MSPAGLRLRGRAGKLASTHIGLGVETDCNPVDGTRVIGDGGRDAAGLSAAGGSATQPGSSPAAPTDDATENLQHRFETIIRADPDLMLLLVRLRSVGLPQWRLVAGCLYQTVWNHLTGRPRGTEIKDYDLTYFDADDLSWEAEDAIIRRVGAATRGCVGPVEVRNQARVHRWFAARFGVRYDTLASADEALQRYASVVHAIGIRLEEDDRFDVAAPFGLEDLFGMIVRPNRVLDNATSHTSKAQRAKTIWPEITVVPWGRATDSDRINNPALHHPRENA